MIPLSLLRHGKHRGAASNLDVPFVVLPRGGIDFRSGMSAHRRCRRTVVLDHDLDVTSGAVPMRTSHGGILNSHAFYAVT
jgi:hypothetical protein